MTWVCENVQTTEWCAFLITISDSKLSLTSLQVLGTFNEVLQLETTLSSFSYIDSLPKSISFEVSEPWVQILPLSSTSCMNLGSNLISLSLCVFIHKT